MDKACTDSRSWYCVIANNNYCCFVETCSGTCDNCGTWSSKKPDRCWACVEVPPIRIPETPDLSPYSCEARRLTREWVYDEYYLTINLTINK